MIFIKLCRNSNNPNSTQVVGTSGRHRHSRTMAKAPGLPGGRCAGALPATRAHRLPRWVFPRIPGARFLAPCPPHGAEHSQVSAALPGTWTSPSRLREAPHKFKAAAASPGPPPHPQARRPSEPQHLPLRPSKFIRPESCLLPVPPLQGRRSHPPVLSSPGLITRGAWVLQAFTQYLLGAVFQVHAGPH